MAISYPVRLFIANLKDELAKASVTEEQAANQGINNFCSRLVAIIWVPVPTSLFIKLIVTALGTTTLLILLDFGFALGPWAVFGVVLSFHIAFNTHLMYQESLDRHHVGPTSLTFMNPVSTIEFRRAHSDVVTTIDLMPVDKSGGVCNLIDGHNRDNDLQ